jgi:hypothetical protein
MNNGLAMTTVERRSRGRRGMEGILLVVITEGRGGEERRRSGLIMVVGGRASVAAERGEMR